MDFMVDLETMGSGPTSVVVQIGAVAFDMQSGQAVAEMIDSITVQSELDLGFTIDGDTVQWWMDQASKDRCTWVHGGRDSRLVWEHFLSWCKTYMAKNSRFWSHSTFDAPIIFYHCQKLGLPSPGRYNMWMDLRTVSMLAKGLASIPKGVRPEGRHDALIDARYQTEWLVKCWKLLKRGEI